MNPSLHKTDPWHLDIPFWRSEKIFGESLFFIHQPDSPFPTARLLFPVTGSLELASACGKTAYREGTDYQLASDAFTIQLPPGSGIPFTKWDALFPPLPGERSIAHLKDHPDTGLYFSEGHFFHDLQAQASYAHASEWQGYRPASAEENLRRTFQRLRDSDPLTLCVCGDSISAGYNASAHTGAAPWMPPYPDLVAEALQNRHGSRVTLHNFAVGGKGVAHGLEVVESLTAKQPDLVIMAYGMNNVSNQSAEDYRNAVQQIMEKIREARPEADFLLVASMLGNPKWFPTPSEPFFTFRDALQSLCGPGTALANLTQIWADLLQQKSYYDLTGNGVNHPNDFGHRIYAQVILDLLSTLE